MLHFDKIFVEIKVCNYIDLHMIFYNLGIQLAMIYAMAARKCKIDLSVFMDVSSRVCRIKTVGLRL